MAPANIYLIRHGDKPEKDDGTEPPYLSPAGEMRAKALIKSFQQYNIGLIIAQGVDDNDDSQRPLDTVNPLATSLGVEIRTFATLNVMAAASTAKNWNGTGDVLICWEHSRLINLAMALGVTNALPYDDFRFDIIWQVKGPSFSNIDFICSEDTDADKGYKHEAWEEFKHGWQKTKAKDDKDILQTWTFEPNAPADSHLPAGPTWTMNNTVEDPSGNPPGDVEKWVQRTEDAKKPYRNQWVRYELKKDSVWKIKKADANSKPVIMV